MSSRKRKVEEIEARVRALYKLEKNSQGPARAWTWFKRWALMLYGEFVRDEVKVRAESLAFLMIFSILPIIAGCFFIFTIFTQFGMVQEALGDLVTRLLTNIPEEHRPTVQEYVLRFKDAYLASISGKSGTLGIFALAVLLWVGLQTSNNVDRTINALWESEFDRPWIEKARNFLVVSVVAPLVLIATLSIPLILHRLKATRALIEALPFFDGFLNLTISAALVLGTFTLLYKLVPVRRVTWRAAATGGIFAAVLLQVADVAMRVYFRLGTNTAYGKAAILPLLCFWIYVVWIVVIMGAELSFLVQNQSFLLRGGRRVLSLDEGEGLLKIVQLLARAHRKGQNPVSMEKFYEELRLEIRKIRALLSFLEQKGLVLRCLSNDGEKELGYVLAREVGEESPAELLKDYYLQNHSASATASDAAAADFARSLKHWLAYFQERRWSDYGAR